MPYLNIIKYNEDYLTGKELSQNLSTLDDYTKK